MKYRLTTYNIFKLHLPLSRQYVGILEKHNDFLVLQEWVNSLHPANTKYITTQETFKVPLKNVTTGTATLSSYPIIKEHKMLSMGKELGFTTHKSAIITTHEVDGKILTILNCHALNFVNNSSWEETMKYWLDQLPIEGPCVIAGDFNTWNPMRTDYLRKTLSSLGYSYAPYEHSVIICFDHIWYREITVTSCELHDTVHTSDHYPLSITFDI